MVTKSKEDTCLAWVQMEDNEKGDLGLLFGLDQKTMVYDQLRSCSCLENADQRKFGSALKGLQSQKILKTRQFPRNVPKAHGVSSNLDCQKKEQNANRRQRQRQAQVQEGKHLHQQTKLYSTKAGQVLGAGKT